jgi:hypothetical protein
MPATPCALAAGLRRRDLLGVERVGKSLLPAFTSQGATPAAVFDVVCPKSGSSTPRTRQRRR